MKMRDKTPCIYTFQDENKNIWDNFFNYKSFATKNVESQTTCN